jgi:hypothetical protein
MFDRLIRGIRKKSFEYSNKLSSALDRDLLAQQTIVTLEKLIQRKQELIYPTSTVHSSDERLRSRGSNALTCTLVTDQYDDLTRVELGAAHRANNSSPIPEEIFDLDF